MKKVLLHISTGDPKQHKKLINQILNIRKELPEQLLEVIIHADATALVLKSESTVADGIAQHITEGVVFKVCQNSLNGLKKHTEDLLPNIEVINSALVYLITEQKNGHYYIKLG